LTPAITRLRERGRGRVAVELDGEPWRLLPAAVVARAGLTCGRPLDRETARELARELRRADALARAGRLLAAQDRSRQELEERLARAGVPPAARTEALAAFVEAGAVDDARLARNRAQELARRGYGNGAIRHDLTRRRIAPDTAAEALATLEPEVDRARELARAGVPLSTVLRRLSARGFSRATLDEIAAFAQEV
jgi:SOS response regulatory protein OraA/RecX